MDNVVLFLEGLTDTLSSAKMLSALSISLHIIRMMTQNKSLKFKIPKRKVLSLELLREQCYK